MGNTRKPIDADDDDSFMEGEFHKASANNDAGSDPPIFGGLIQAAGGAMAERNYYVRKAISVPRNHASIKQQLREECMHAGDMMFYSWGKGDNHVEGGSIGLAMTLARLWGNCVIECLPPQESATSFILTTRFIDLETGFTNERPFRQSKKSKVAGSMDEERKMDTRFQVGYSKAARNVVKNSISFYLWDQAIKWAKEGTKKKIEDWIANLDKQSAEGDGTPGITIAQDKTVRSLMKYGMTEYAILSKAGVVNRGGLQVRELVQLAAARRAIEEGYERADELFPEPSEEERKRITVANPELAGNQVKPTNQKAPTTDKTAPVADKTAPATDNPPAEPAIVAELRSALQAAMTTEQVDDVRTRINAVADLISDQVRGELGVLDSKIMAKIKAGIEKERKKSAAKKEAPPADPEPTKPAEAIQPEPEAAESKPADEVIPFGSEAFERASKQIAEATAIQTLAFLTKQLQSGKISVGDDEFADLMSLINDRKATLENS